MDIIIETILWYALGYVLAFILILVPLAARHGRLPYPVHTYIRYGCLISFGSWLSCALLLIGFLMVACNRIVRHLT